MPMKIHALPAHERCVVKKTIGRFLPTRHFTTAAQQHPTPLVFPPSIAVVPFAFECRRESASVRVHERPLEHCAHIAGARQ